MVVLGGVEDEVAQEFSGGGVDDADLELVDEQQDVGSGVGSADADVVQAPVVAQGDDACFVDAVLAHAVVRVVAGGAGGGFRACGVGGRGRAAVGQRAVRGAGVVLGDEGVDELL
ncbi:hypothetical protein BJF88_11065 [Cellulosimicrobium sp. CUA-896]|nr:hypothetical protein BJF88_11065 [Cellulosimicrobium sp. CUA-896]